MESTAGYTYLRDLVFSYSQNVLDPSRDYLFETRLSRVMRNQGLNSIDELVRSLRTARNATHRALHC